MSRNNFRRTRLLAAGAFLSVAGVLAVAPARAHMAPIPAKEMVRSARFIVVAKVAGARAEWNERHNLIITRYTLETEDRLKGEAAWRFDIEVVGGSLDGETRGTCITVHLEVGHRYVLFLNDPARPSFSAFIGARDGVIPQLPSVDGGGPAVALSEPLAAVAGGYNMPFDTFLQRLRALIVQTESEPVPAPLTPTVNDPPLPRKTYDPSSVSLPEWRIQIPVRGPETVGPGRPDAPVRVYRDETAVKLAPPPLDQEADFYYSPLARRYIVWNEFPPNSSFYPHDQYMMSRWNLYGDIHRVSGSPSGTWSFGNNRFDMAGFPSDQDMLSQFGRAWGPGELGVTYYSYSGSTILEADVALNPAFYWTLDDDYATRSISPAWGFHQTVLHELGHAWGLQHPWEFQDVWWDSVMNYSPKEFRFPVLHADDTSAIRSAYPGILLHDGHIALYRTQDNQSSNHPLYFKTFPTSTSVYQGGSFDFNQGITLENVGTGSILSPTVEIWLSAKRMQWDHPQYLETFEFSTNMGAGQSGELYLGHVDVPDFTPPGEWSVGAYLWLVDEPDEQGYNNEAWGEASSSKLTVFSWPRSIAMGPDWGDEYLKYGPKGSWRLYFWVDASQRFDLSTCPEDGGYTDGATLLISVFDPLDFELDNDNYLFCEGGSWTSYETTLAGQYYIITENLWQGGYGETLLRFRERRFTDDLPQLHVSKQAGDSSVNLSWLGRGGPYDVERATRPDFSDAVRLATGSEASEWSEPSDGGTYFYRVR